MAPTAQAHKRAHSLLLFEKLLNLRDNASPLNLVFDTLEQSAQPLLREFMRRTKIERGKIVFVSFATLKKPIVADVFIKARGKSLNALAAEIASHLASPRPPSSDGPAASAQRKTLIIIDTLNPLASQAPHLLPAFFSAIISPPASLVAVYHTDVPALRLPAQTEYGTEYAPHPLNLLSHLATATFRVSNLAHAAEAHRARERSLPEPEWGLREGREGVLVGLPGSNGRGKSSDHAERGQDGGGADGGSSISSGGEEGFVVDMEMRRRSGRAVAERFVLVQTQTAKGGRGRGGGGGGEGERRLAVMLMRDYPAFRAPLGGDGSAGDGVGEKGGGEDMETTFNLGLTEKQRRDREGVVLPYFDAQVEVGGGEGGRILYEMGREDDFDEEEDEI